MTKKNTLRTGLTTVLVTTTLAVPSGIERALAQTLEADLSIAKTVDNATPHDGDTIVYTLTASNAGPADPATGVKVSDALPAGVTYFSDNGGGAYDSGTGVWTIGNLAVSTPATLNITATVDANTDGRTIDNTATISGDVTDPVPANNSGTASITVGIDDLCAKTGTMSLPGRGTPITVWGYVPGTCVGAPALTAPGGPVIAVDQGDSVSITLHNDLTEDTALLFDGQRMVPDTTGATPGGSATYVFTADRPGSTLYEAGLLPNAQHQNALGLYGLLVVRPTGAPNQAYASATTAFDTQAPVLLGEIDPALNDSVNPATFDLRDYAPKYYLINGKPYPNSAPIPAIAGDDVLLRFANAGLLPHAMGVLGTQQRVLSSDGNALPFEESAVAKTIAPGETVDAIVSIPAAGKYAVYDTSMLLHNNGPSTAGQIDFGGMMTFIEAGDAISAQAPTTSGTTLTPAKTALNVPVALTSTAMSPDGSTTIEKAEYFVDTIGLDDTGTAMIGAFSGTPEVLTATIPGGLPDGNHTIYVHAYNSFGWGSFDTAILRVDAKGPTTSALVLAPNPTGGAAVTLTGTADDRASGSSDIAAAEYWIDAGAPVAMTANTTASPVASISGVIPATVVGSLIDGDHFVSVRSQDALGNWGDPATKTLTVDKTGPTTTSVLANPNPSNGKVGVNSSTPVVRVTASVSDASSGGSKIATAEGFIDTVGANGTGFLFFASDGSFNNATEAVQADIPLATINALSQGTHTIYVHGKDAVGNWGATATVALVVDKTAPTFTGITVSPNPTNGASTVTMTVLGATDTGGSGVAGGEYWLCPTTCTAPAAGQATQFSGLTASIPVGSLTTGTYTVNARVRDGARNWSTGAGGIRTATLNVVASTIFSDGFESGVLPGAWSAISTTTTNRLNVTAGAALKDLRGLQARGDNTNYVQYNFGTAAIPVAPIYDARFYFRPNGNTSTGKDIFSAATTSTNAAFNAPVFRVRYRLNGAQPEAQIQVGATVNATWVNITNAPAGNVIEVVWQSGVSLQLYVNGSVVQTLPAGTSSVGAIRMGSVTNTGNNTLMYFDGFVSKRTATPVIGP